MSDRPVIRISRASIDRRKAAEERAVRSQWWEGVTGSLFPGFVLALIALAAIAAFAGGKPGWNLLLSAGASGAAVFLTVHVARAQAAGRVGVLSHGMMNALPGLAALLTGLVITAGAFLVSAVDSSRAVAVWLPPLPVAVILTGAMWGNPLANRLPRVPVARPAPRNPPRPAPVRPIPGRVKGRIPRAVPVSKPTPNPQAGRVKVSVCHQCKGCLGPLEDDEPKRVCPLGHEVHAACVASGLVKCCPECKRAFC